MANKKIRYAVVGLGHISQIAALPAFDHTRKSEVTALVSGDSKKLKHLGKKYGIQNLYSYEEYAQCLESGEIDAVYIGLPNHLHREYAERAARAGVHVLCEKPMAVTSEDCQAMMEVCKKNRVKLMIAYRLHFEKTNLKVVDLVESGKIGDPRFFVTSHSQAIREGDVRTYPIEMGGGPTYDMGIYGINAARYIFGSEPKTVYAEVIWGKKKPYLEIEESVVITLSFPGEKLATIVTSFGSTSTDRYQVVGSKGEIKLEKAYTYIAEKTIELTVNGKKREICFEERDQFAAEFDYFSGCILENKGVEPSGKEGLADVRIIEAVFESARSGKRIELEFFRKEDRPDLRLEISRPPVENPPEEFRASGPSRKGEAA